MDRRLGLVETNAPASSVLSPMAVCILGGLICCENKEETGFTVSQPARGYSIIKQWKVVRVRSARGEWTKFHEKMLDWTSLHEERRK